MCGIAGIMHLDGAPASGEILQRMTDAISHRGPDGEGQFVEKSLGLGHRRLSVIDLSSAGHQPMMDPTSRFVISYNGEIYNFRQLKTELEAKGYAFHSSSDTEVCLNALIEWGEKAIEKFNGMFALALWDRKDNKLFLARDRYGIKPLYYVKMGNTFLFASEVKAILQHPDYRVSLCKPALLEYFTFQNLFSDQTMFSDVKLIPPGSYLNIKIGQTSEPEPTRYWDYEFHHPENPKTESEYLDEFDHLFHQAVSRHLVSDVPVGSYLSGGMDSGAISYVASRQIESMKTFTIGFDLSSASGLELGFDERAQAEQMSYLCGSEHYEMVLKAGDMEKCMTDLVWHLEDLRVGQSYPNYYAAKLAKSFGKVVLAGTGSDELFGGYPWRYYRAVVNDNFEDYIDKYYLYWQRLISNTDIHEVFAPIRDDIKDIRTRDIFRNVFDRHAESLTSPEDYINHSLYFEAKTFLHGLLVVEDKLSMAHGLENRVPFLDNELVDFAMGLPVQMKLGNLKQVVQLNENNPGKKTQLYFEKTSDGKMLLRKGMKKYLPDTMTSAVKKGFSAPDASWFRGESIEFVRETIFQPRALIYDYFDKKKVQKLISEHLNGDVNRRLLVWSLLNFECWLQTFIADGSPEIRQKVIN